MELSVDAIRNDDRITAPTPLDLPASGILEAGTQLGGSYRLIRRLAEGGMAEIYLASHERLAGLLAVKVLKPSLAGDPDVLLRFQQEAEVMTTIRHPNVVQVLDFDSTSLGMPYMVMEYLPGQDLYRLMDERTLTPAEIARIVRKVAAGLDAAHRLGVVHRDLKLENIMVVPCEGQQDIIKLIDFGICKARRFSHPTGTSELLGTPEFMSPEQALGRNDEIEARSDQFALAVVSYVLLTGQTPWGTTDPIATLNRIVNHAPLPLATTLSSPCESVESVLFRGMAKTADERYPSTLIFSRALERAMIMDGLLPENSISERTLSPEPVEQIVANTPVPYVFHNQVGQVGPKAGTKCAARGKHRPHRRPRYLWETAVLLIALICGGSVGMLDLTEFSADAARGWSAVQDFAATAAAKSTSAAERHLAKLWQAGVEYLVTVAGN